MFANLGPPSSTSTNNVPNELLIRLSDHKYSDRVRNSRFVKMASVSSNWMSFDDCPFYHFGYFLLLQVATTAAFCLLCCTVIGGAESAINQQNQDLINQDDDLDDQTAEKKSKSNLKMAKEGEKCRYWCQIRFWASYWFINALAFRYSVAFYPSRVILGPADTFFSIMEVQFFKHDCIFVLLNMYLCAGVHIHEVQVSTMSGFGCSWCITRKITDVVTALIETSKSILGLDNIKDNT